MLLQWVLTLVSLFQNRWWNHPKGWCHNHSFQLHLISHLVKSLEHVFIWRTLKHIFCRNYETDCIEELLRGENYSWIVNKLKMNLLWILSWMICRKHTLAEHWEWNNVCNRVAGIKRQMFWHVSDDELDGRITVIVILKYGKIVTRSDCSVFFIDHNN